jgi:hydroxypyruvate isomerase
MPKFAANLSLLYPELPFLDRFEAAAKDGFKAVEYLFPYAFEPAELAARLKNNGLQQVLFNGYTRHRLPGRARSRILGGCGIGSALRRGPGLPASAHDGRHRPRW